MKVLLVYSSRFGHTTQIIYRIAKKLENSGHETEIRPVTAVKQLPSDIEAVILGASVRYGFFAKAAQRFVKYLGREHATIPSGFVGVNLAAAKPEKSTIETNVYARKFLAKSGWKPNLVKLFGGELNFALYNKIDTACLKPILAASGKPWGADVNVDYTNWGDVDKFSDEFIELLNKKNKPATLKADS